MTTSGRLILPLTEPAFTDVGVLDPGALLTVYLTGTTTLAELFGDAALASPIANPQTADSAGRFYAQASAIYADASQAYDCRLLMTDGELFTWDAVELLATVSGGGAFMPISGGTFTGPVSGPTPPANDDSNLLATTAFVQEEIEPLAPISSPAFTGTPTVPTPPPGTDTDQVVNAEFVTDAIAAIPARIYAVLSIASGVVTVRSQNGFGPIGRSGAGAYNFNFSTPMPDLNYGITTGVCFATALVAMMATVNKTVNSFSVQVLEPSNNIQQDPIELYIEVIGA